MKMLVEILQWKASYLVLFAKRVHTLIPSYASFADVGYIRDVVVLQVN